ncbi:MAG: MATE family efflux transporter [Oscillibacter sp.]|nr:MATE family efflux transporter [Oscillibacter sp.]
MAEINKMESRPILPLIVSMSVPPLISMFMQYSYNFVDCMFVSWISEEALTAVSLAFPITTLMIAMSIGLGVGVNVLISNRLGQKRFEEANQIAANGIVLSAGCGMVITAVVLMIIEPFFASFAESGAIYEYGMQYMRVCAFMEVSNMVHICIQKILQGTGNMLAPMGFQIAGVVLNYILDPVLIFGRGPFPAMGIRGAAVATVAGYTFSMLLAFWVLLCTKQKVRLSARSFRIDLRIFRDVFVIGFPSFLMNALGAVMILFTNWFLKAYSMTAVAFFGAYFKLQQVVVMTLNGLVQGCIPIMSYNFGAKNGVRLRQALRYGTVIACLLTGLSIVILWAFPEQILRIFKASSEMMAFGVPAVRIMSMSYVFAAISTMLASFMQSTKRVGYSLLVNALRQLVILIPMMWAFSRWFGMSGIWWSFIVTETAAVLIAWALHRRNRVTL